MRKNFNKGPKKNTSWQNVSGWYNRVTNEGRGHYYHQNVVLPNVLKLLNLSSEPQALSSIKILDLGCGNGVLANSLPQDVQYLGIDASPTLINTAKAADKNPNHIYLTADVTKPVAIPTDFTHAIFILSLQNMSNASGAIAMVSRHLVSGGKLIIVLNHPVFRIPRHSSWEVDKQKKIEYRRIDKYLSPMVIPVKMNPSDPRSQETLSYHLPLSSYSSLLKKSGFLIEDMQEWTSDKESQVGKTAKMENRARSEFPLFMAIKATKI